MAGPGNEMTTGAARHDRMRASHADREQVVEVLKAAFVQGRLDSDEFGLRIGRALTSRTYADLAALTADLPARLASAPVLETAQPPSPPARESSRNKKAIVALTGATFALPIIFMMPWIPDDSPFAIPFILLMFALYTAVPTGWLVVFHAWLDKRAGQRQSAEARYTLRATPP
jgi:uncharacterized protein DUF1707